MTQNVDLVSIFKTVTQALAENQQTLNQADQVNQDHGTNMVQTFQTITGALQQKQGSPDSAALGYAAKKLSENTSSSSGQLYAQGLAQAANQFQGQTIDAAAAMQLLQTLISGGQTQAPQQTQPAQPAGGDLLGSLLGSLTGGGQTPPPQQPQPQQPAGGDLLGSLLGSLVGGGQPQQPQQTQPAQPAGGDLLGSLLGGLAGGKNTNAGLSDGLDLGDLLNAGMAFMSSKQRGGTNLDAIIQAFMSVSGMGNTAHRTQSTQLVVGSFLQALGSLNAQR